jgi:hypothetical protein
MAANNQPIFVKQGNTSSDNGTAFPGTLTTATGDYTGVSANHQLVHTAGADGSYVRSIKFKSLGTNVASVARIYLNNGSANTTATNNNFIGEISLPATTASNTQGTAEPEYKIDLMLEPGFRIYVGLGTTVAAGWKPSCNAGDY